MKNVGWKRVLQRLSALVMALVMVCTLAVPAAAAEPAVIEKMPMGQHAWYSLDPAVGEMHIWGRGELFDTSSSTESFLWQKYNKEIKSVYIEEGITHLGSETFVGCSNLTSVRLPESLESIGDNAFSGCTSLQEIHIPERVHSIGKYAFHSCSSLKELHLPQAVTEIRFGLCQGCTDLRTITMGNQVDLIDGRAMLECASLASLVVPDSVKYIGSMAFDSCTSLAHLRLGSGLEWMPANAVDGTAWYQNQKDGLLLLDGCVLGWKGPMASGTQMALPSSVRLLAAEAFESCGNLKSITIPEGIRELPDGAFNGCGTLEEVHLPDTLAAIGGAAFSNCRNLRDIRIPEGVRTIGDYVFKDCTSLSQMQLPASVERVGADLMMRTAWMRRQPSGPVYMNHVLLGQLGTMPSDYHLDIRPGTKVIAGSAMWDQRGLVRVTFPEGLREIPDMAFYGTSLESLDLPETVTHIGSMAFKGCPFQGVSLPKGLKVIGSEAFADTDLQSVRVPGSVEEMEGFGIFEACPLTTVTLEEGLKEVPHAMFSQCAELTEIHIPGSVKTIAYNAFDGCSALRNVTLEEGLEMLEDFAFSECTSLTKLTMPKTLQRINRGCFEKCTYLREIWFQGAAPAIFPTAFNGDQLTLYYPGTDPTWTESFYLTQGMLGKLRWEPYGPPAPAMTVTVGSNGTPQLSWEESPVAGSSYQVYCQVDNGSSQLLKETTSTHLNHTSAKPGHVYDYGLTYTSNGFVSERGPGAQYIWPCATPSLHAEVDLQNNIRLSWDAVDGAAGYSIHVQVNGGGWVHVRSNIQDTSYLYTPEDPTSTYTFRIMAQARDERADGAWSALCTVRPEKPTLPTTPALQVRVNPVTGKPEISWEKVPNVDYYVVNITSFEEHLSFEKKVNGTMLRHTSATPGVEYSYQVSAWRGDFHSRFSASRTAVAHCATPQVEAALNGDGKPVLTWKAIDGASGYTIARCANGGRWEYLDTVDGLRCTDASARAGVKYSYQVMASCARSSAGDSCYSDSVSITCGGKLNLTVPSLRVQVKESDGKPYLEWEAVPGAAKYEVRVSTGDGYSHLITTGGTRVRHGSAKPGIIYQYVLQALDGDRKSEWSEPVRAVCQCARPVVRLSVRSDGKPVLSWDSVEGAFHYEVKVSVDGGSYTRLAQPQGTRLTHSSAQYGHRYRYTVTALSKFMQGDSAPAQTDEIRVERHTSRPGTPALTVTNKRSTGKPYLKWTAVDGAEKYEVYRATSKNGTYSRLTTTGGTAITNSTTTAGRTYYYKVRAVGANGVKGLFSTIKTRTCDLARPDVKLVIRSGHPYLSWKSISGAIKYDVYCSMDGGDFTRLVSVKGTHLTHSSAKRGHTYRYRVRAIASRSAANSAYSYYDTITVK